MSRELFFQTATALPLPSIATCGEPTQQSPVDRAVGGDHTPPGDRVTASITVRPPSPKPIWRGQTTIASPLSLIATSGRCPNSIVVSAIGADHTPRAGRVAASTT